MLFIHERIYKRHQSKWQSSSRSFCVCVCVCGRVWHFHTIFEFNVCACVVWESRTVNISIMTLSFHHSVWGGYTEKNAHLMMIIFILYFVMDAFSYIRICVCISTLRCVIAKTGWEGIRWHERKKNVEND